MWLDLRGGQAIKLCAGHNIQGARQPAYMHIGACKPVSVGRGPVRAPGPGHGRVIKRNEITCSFVLSIQDAEMHLGLWWLDVAVRGAVPQLPIVNLEPQFCTEAEAAAIAAAPKPRPASGAPRCSAKPPRVHADQLAPPAARRVHLGGGGTRVQAHAGGAASAAGLRRVTPPKGRNGGKGGKGPNGGRGASTTTSSRSSSSSSKGSK